MMGGGCGCPADAQWQIRNKIDIRMWIESVVNNCKEKKTLWKGLAR